MAKIQKFQEEIGIKNNPPKIKLKKITKMLLTFLTKNDIYFSKVDGNNIMLVPNNDAIENYVYTKNNDIVYNCQITDDDLSIHIYLMIHLIIIISLILEIKMISIIMEN